MPRYFAYCRKSSEDEDHQVLSIESQREELRRFANRENLAVIEVLQEARSAKAPGRPVFDSLVKRVERGEADGILAWHPDRLARNALDGGMIIHLLDLGRLVSLKFPTYTFENTSQGKFMLAIMFGQSKYYVDSLSENVRRGNRTKRERGWLPSCAPIGYLNTQSDSGEKIITSDPIRFPLLKKLWALLLTNAYSVAELQRIAKQSLGLRTPSRKRIGGQPLSVSGLYRVFSNCFYAGQIGYQGERFPGRHEPLVTIAQFERAQEIIGKGTRVRPKIRHFAYTGLMRCGSCGAAITAEDKVNRHGKHYVYYHCTHRRVGSGCRQGVIQEANLEEQILSFLRRFEIDRHELSRVFAILESERDKERASAAELKVALAANLEKVRKSLDGLTKLRYRDLISEEEFTRQRSELVKEEAGLSLRLQEVGSAVWFEPSRNLFSFSNRAAFWLTHGEIDEKRLIVATAGSNPTLMDRKLSIDAAYPFSLLESARKNSDWRATVNDVRTFFLKETAVVIPFLPDPDEQLMAA